MPARSRLDVKDEVYGIDLRRLTLRLARDAAAQVEGYGYGEIPALLELSGLVLAWIKAEAEDPEDRQQRYARQRAVLNLLTLCEGICRFHGGRRRASDVAKFRDLVADALRGLVS